MYYYYLMLISCRIYYRLCIVHFLVDNIQCVCGLGENNLKSLFCNNLLLTLTTRRIASFHEVYNVEDLYAASYTHSLIYTGKLPRPSGMFSFLILKYTSTAYNHWLSEMQVYRFIIFINRRSLIIFYQPLELVIK